MPRNFIPALTLAAAGIGFFAISAAQAAPIFLPKADVVSIQPAYEIIPAVGAGLDPRERRELDAKRERALQKAFGTKKTKKKKKALRSKRKSGGTLFNFNSGN